MYITQQNKLHIFPVPFQASIFSSRLSVLSPSRQSRLPLNRVGFWRCFIVRAPDLDCLVCLTADQPQPRVIKSRAKDTILSIKRAWLGNSVHGLVAIASLPILCVQNKSQISKKLKRELVWTSSECGLSALTQKLIEPLSPPEKRILSLLTESVLMMALWPSKFCIKAPSGHFHCLMLDVLPVAKVNSEG